MVLAWLFQYEAAHGGDGVRVTTFPFYSSSSEHDGDGAHAAACEDCHDLVPVRAGPLASSVGIASQPRWPRSRRSVAADTGSDLHPVPTRLLARAAVLRVWLVLQQLLAHATLALWNYFNSICLHGALKTHTVKDTAAMVRMMPVSLVTGIAPAYLALAIAELFYAFLAAIYVVAADAASNCSSNGPCCRARPPSFLFPPEAIGAFDSAHAAGVATREALRQVSVASGGGGAEGEGGVRMDFNAAWGGASTTTLSQHPGNCNASLPLRSTSPALDVRAAVPSTALLAIAIPIIAALTALDFVVLAEHAPGQHGRNSAAAAPLTVLAVLTPVVGVLLLLRALQPLVVLLLMGVARGCQRGLARVVPRAP